MTDLLLRARLRLAETLRRGVFSVVAAAFALVALGFFTAALWMGLVLGVGVILATLIVGGLYLAVALVFFVLAARERHMPPPDPYARHRRPAYAPPEERPVHTLEVLLEGVRLGVEAGRLLRGPRRWR